MTKETLIEVVQTLTGSCFPYGSTHEDEERFNNLELKIALSVSLLKEIEESSRLRNRHEWSIKKISTRAYEHLLETKEWLDEILGETE